MMCLTNIYTYTFMLFKVTVESKILWWQKMFHSLQANLQPLAFIIFVCVQRHVLWAAPNKSLHYWCCCWTQTHLEYSCWPLGWTKQRTYKQTSVRKTLASMLISSDSCGRGGWQCPMCVHYITTKKSTSFCCPCYMLNPQKIPGPQ